MAKKKPDPTKKRVLVARHSNDLDFLIGLGASSGIQSSAPADDLGIDIDEDAADVGGGTSDSIDIVALIKEAKSSKVPRDLKFDDSSLPEASNFYQWAASPDYLNYTPFLEQILIGVRLFGEYCPTCSNVEWMDINNHEPQEGIPGMLKNVTLLEHGVCPKCNGRRSQFFKNKKLKFYNELAVCAGQRCVVGSTLLNTAHGLRRIGDLLDGVEVTDEDRIEVTGLEVLIDNKPCKVTHLIRQAKGEQLVCARLANGVELEGTESHGIESWASSYRPLAGADKSPVVVQRNTLTYNEMRCANIIRTVNPNQTLGEDRARKIILGLADTIGRMAVNPNQRTSFFVDNSDYLDVAYRLTKGCFSDNELIRLPDFLLTGGREIAHSLAEGLDLSGDPVKLAGVSDDVARDIQTLLIGIGMPVMRHGRVLWLDAVAYDDFSSLKDDVLRTVPEFETDGWDRHSLRSVVYGFDHNHPLYSLRRLVLGEFSVFTANIEHTKPQHTWTLEVPCGQRYVVNGVMSENSGKSIVVAMLSTYITHRVLKMQKPTRFYNVGDNQILQGTFVALTQAQAKDTLWEPYYGFILTAPWFQRYHALIRRYEAMYGVDVMKIRDTFVLYRHRNLLVYPAGPDKRVLRGRTRIFYSIDEIGWFDNDASSNKVKTGANEVNIALERSCLTCRLVEIPSVEEGNDKAFTAYAMNVSSPSDYRDKICELLRLSQTSDKILGIHAPSWKMNPGITRESLAEEFRKSPITSARDYGASPPVSANPFITPVVVDNAMREKGRNEILYAQHTERRSSGISVERSSYGMITKIASCSRPSVLAIDAGEVNNSFAFTCTSKDEAGRARIDIVGEIMASPTAPINFTLLFDHILLPIIKARNVRVLLADRWQSNKILSDALALCDGLMQAKKYSLKYADMCDVRNMMQGDQLTFPRSTYVKSVTEILQQDLTDYPACFAGKPVEHFMYQLVTIQDARQQVVKGVGVTDDIWRSAALSVWGITNPDYALFLAEDKAVAARNGDPSRLGVIGSLGNARSGGSRQTTQSGVVGNLAGVLKSRR